MSHEEPEPRDQRQSDHQASPEEGQTRRGFLRVAVVGSAVAATAVGAGAAVVRATPLGPRLLGSVQPATNQASGQVVFDPCFEDTQFIQLSSFNVHAGHASPGSFFLWFTAYDLPAGTYTISITPDPGDTTTPFQLADAGNGAFLFKLAANTASQCPSSDPTDQVAAGHTVDSVFPYTFTGANSDLQLKVHLDYDGGTLTSDAVYSFTGTLQNGASVTLGTSSISVTAHAS